MVTESQFWSCHCLQICWRREWRGEQVHANWRRERWGKREKLRVHSYFINKWKKCWKRLKEQWERKTGRSLVMQDKHVYAYRTGWLTEQDDRQNQFAEKVRVCSKGGKRTKDRERKEKKEMDRKKIKKWKEWDGNLLQAHFCLLPGWTQVTGQNTVN